jgi:surface antigen
MKLFNFPSKKRPPAQGFPSKDTSQQPQLQAFILEPILTPSGIVDGVDDAPDPLLLDVEPLPEIDELSVDSDADFAVDDTPDLFLDVDDLSVAADADIHADDIIPVDFFEADEFAATWIDLGNPNPVFQSGVFTVGETGEVGIDFLFDGGGYQGELAIFSLEGMEEFELGSDEFIQEAARRSLSNSESGYVVISDPSEGARFSASLPHEGSFNSGEYQGVSTVSMKPGDTFGVMLVPNGRVQQVFENPTVEGAVRPLFSLATANPDDGFHVGQIADVTGDGNTFVFEDLRVDEWTDKDYNDIVFQVRGATGKAALLDDVIDPAKDWRSTDMGQALIAYAEPYITPDGEDGGAIAIDPTTDNSGIITDSIEIDNEDAIADATIPDNEDIEDDGDAITTDPITDNSDIATSPVDDATVVEDPTDVGEARVVETVQPKRFEFAKADQPLVGVIDTGFSANNPDIDYSRITLGQDRIDGDANPLLSSGEGNEHGTHILGIIGATQDNGVGIDGINDEAPLWLGRAVGSGKWADSLVEFVNAAQESGQPNAVVNLSLDLTQINPDSSVTTRYEFTPQERAAIEYARQHNVLIVVAAGNDGGVMSALGQASQEFDNIITVGAAERVNDSVALSKAYDRTEYSSYGYGLDILAPGGSIDNPKLSLTGDGVGTMAGSSVATAKVTGAVSQVWAANPDLSYRQVLEIIKDTATDLKDTGWDLESGAGLLNIVAAVHLAKVTKPEEYEVRSTLFPETWSGEGKVTPGERAVNYPIVRENFSGWVMPNIGVALRNSPRHEDRSGLAEPYRKTLYFDAWTYGERVNDYQLGTPDELWYRISGTNYWVPSAYIYGFPGSRPPVLAPAQPQPQPPTPTPTPTPIPQVPINANSPNYRSGPVNPFAYNWIGQCTWYTYGRMLETGLLPAAIKNNALFRGHAGTWKRDAERVGLPVTSTPTPGARGIVVWPPNVKGAGSVGHVAFLEEVYPDGRIRITEANWPTGSWIKERILTPAQYAGVSFVRLENAQTNNYYAPPGTPGQSRQYIVRAGDTLSGIAQRELGNANRWREIMKTPNGGTFTEAEARLLQVGQSVYLPVTRQVGSGVPVTPPPLSNPTPGTNSEIRWVNFSGTVGPSIGVNLRNSPRFSDRSSRNEPYNKRLEFDAWTYGEVVNDLWLGTPDARWFKVKGTNLWVPSAYINGNPPNSSPMPGGKTTPIITLPRTGGESVPDINTLSISANGSNLGVNYKIGSPIRPDYTWGRGYGDLPKDQPQWHDYLREDTFRTIVQSISWLIPDGAAAYFHYLDGTGTERPFSYQKYIDQDPSGRTTMDNILLDVKSAAEKIYQQAVAQYPAFANHEVTFNITSGAIAAGADVLPEKLPYPKTANWQTAIGSHLVWVSASVTVLPNQPPVYQMDFTLHAEDKYDFNPEQRASSRLGGINDGLNGHLEVVGLAKSYINKATLSSGRIWTEGQGFRTLVP